jgi:thymidylate synthase (FAD)
MEITIISYPNNWMDLAYLAGRNCYGMEKIPDNISSEEKIKFCKLLIKNMHESVLEHINISIYFKGVSRAFMSQITRHRLVSFSVKSQHYTDYSDEKFYNYNKHKKLFDNINSAYKLALKTGMPKYEARYLLPEASLTNIFMTANAREWRYILKLRCSTKNVPEMRIIMTQTLKKLYQIMPIIFNDLVTEYARIH